MIKQKINNVPCVWVGCLASYNSGQLIGEWLEVDSDPGVIWEEIEAILKKTGGEEWQIFDSEHLPGGVSHDVQALADYRQALEAAVSAGIPEEVYAALVDDRHGELLAPDAINMYGAAEDARGAGLAFCESIGGKEELSQVIDITNFIDWERLGRHLLYEMQICGGYLVEVSE